ncbi:hypothetical protein LTR28_006048 [Elasticomyces elasticus]|nr:hypothetical protein LTR28_006048 [Elasticomyces elasticus]
MPPSRTPSPAVPAPIPTAPGPRATALQKVFADALGHTIKKCEYGHFAACFPTAARAAPDAMAALHREFVGKLEGGCNAEFEAILADRNVVASLNELDELINQARRRRERAEEQAKADSRPVDVPVQPHTLPPSSLYLAHLAPALASHQVSLQQRLQSVQSENVDLLRIIQQQRQEMEAMVQGLEDAVEDLSVSAEALDPDRMMELTREAVAVDEELRMRT